MSEKTENNAMNSMIETAMRKMREFTGTDTVIGEAVTLPNGATAVSVCKVTFGFGSGGADLAPKGDKPMFGGGVGSGVSITPIAFLVTNGSGVKLLQLDTVGTTADKIVGAVPDVIDKVSGIISGFKGEDDGTAQEEE